MARVVVKIIAARGAFRRDLFARHVALDPGGTTMPRITALHMLRSTSLGLSFRSRLAERLGTTIVIENKPGVLTRLALHLNIKTSFR